MEGFIKIETTTKEGREGLSVKTALSDVSFLDRVVIVNSVCNALNITPEELKLMSDLIDSDLMEALVDTIKLQDDSEEPWKAEVHHEG